MSYFKTLKWLIAFSHLYPWVAVNPSFFILRLTHPPLVLPLIHSAMNDLLQTMAVAGSPSAQWAGSSENLDGAEAGDGAIPGCSRRSGQRMKELALSTNAIDYAALTLPSAGHNRAKLRLQVKGPNPRWFGWEGTNIRVNCDNAVSVSVSHRKCFLWGCCWLLGWIKESR